MRIFSVVLPVPECQARSWHNIRMRRDILRGPDIMSWIYYATHPDGINAQGMRVILICASDIELQKVAAVTKAALSGECSFIDLSDWDITCAEQSRILAAAAVKVKPVIVFVPASARIPFHICNVTHICIQEDRETIAFDRETSKVTTQLVRFSMAETARNTSMAWPSAHWGPVSVAVANSRSYLAWGIPLPVPPPRAFNEHYMTLVFLMAGAWPGVHPKGIQWCFQCHEDVYQTTLQRLMLMGALEMDEDTGCPRWKGRRAWATFKVLHVLEYNLEAAFFAAAAVEASATANTAAATLFMATFFALGVDGWNSQEASVLEGTEFMADLCKAVPGPFTHLFSRGDVWISLGLHFWAAAFTEGFSGECAGHIDIIPGIRLNLSLSKALDGLYRECAKHLGLETLSIPTGFTPEEENFIMRMLFGSYMHCAVMRNIVEDHGPASHASTSGSLPTKVVLTDVTSTQTVTMQPFTKCAFPSLMEPDDRGPLIVLGLDLLKYRNAAEARQNTSSSSWEVGRMTEIPDAVVTEWLESLQATGVTKASIQEMLRSLFVPSLNDWEL